MERIEVQADPTGYRAVNRVLAWFSCGASSAVAAKLAIDAFGDRVTVAYCNTSASEHPDNERFLREVSVWLGTPVTILQSKKYLTIDDVFERTRYMSGIAGARCAVEMKKVPRFDFQLPDDTHVFGLSSDEGARIASFKANNPELNLCFPLAEQGIDRRGCHERLHRAGIELPAMYALGYRNNNCIGCVKASSARYWNMIRRDFPAVFARRSEQSRRLGVRLTRVNGQRAFLDELPEGHYGQERLENVSCGPDCGTQGEAA